MVINLSRRPHDKWLSSEHFEIGKHLKVSNEAIVDLQPKDYAWLKPTDEISIYVAAKDAVDECLNLFRMSSFNDDTNKIVVMGHDLPPTFLVAATTALIELGIKCLSVAHIKDKDEGNIVSTRFLTLNTMSFVIDPD